MSNWSAEIANDGALIVRFKGENRSAHRLSTESLRALKTSIEDYLGPNYSVERQHVEQWRNLVSDALAQSVNDAVARLLRLEDRVLKVERQEELERETVRDQLQTVASDLSARVAKLEADGVPPHVTAELTLINERLGNLESEYDSLWKEAVNKLLRETEMRVVALEGKLDVSAAKNEPPRVKLGDYLNVVDDLLRGKK